MQKTALCNRDRHAVTFLFSEQEEERKCRVARFMTKTLLVMKLTFIFMMIGLLHVHARGVSQQITFSGEKVKLAEIFQVIKKQTGFYVISEKALLKKSRPVTVNAVNQPLEEFVRTILDGQNLRFSIENNTIVLSPKTVIELPEAQPGNYSEADLLAPITGQIVDAKGEPLQGVSVKIKGTTIGVSSDDNGKFSINAMPQQVLVFSYIGMAVLEIKVKDLPANGRIVMKASDASMSDVVITGYSNIKKGSFTGSYTQVSKEDILRVSPNNLIQALQVFDPSLRIMQNIDLGSNPNALPEFYIRGQSGFPGVKELDKVNGGAVSQFALKNNPNLPIFIMDGFEVSLEKIYDLDINRIKEINILKDAAATAIYGSRASNGVIVIETIAPKPGEFRVTYSGNYSITTPDLSSYNMMDAKEKLAAEVAAGVFLPHKDIAPEGYEANLVAMQWNYRLKQNEVNKGINTYWLSQPLSTMFNNKHNIYLEGGSEAIRVGLEFRYDKQNGVMKGSSRDRIGGGLTLNYLHKGIQIRNQTYFDVVNAKESPYGSFADFSRMQPYYNKYDETWGTYILEYPDYGSRRDKNPLYEASLGNRNNSGYNEWTNNFTANVSLSKFLLIKSQFAVNYKDADTELFKDPKSVSYARIDAFKKGDLTLSETKNLNWNANLFAAYNRMIGLNNVNFSIGMNAKSTKDSYITSAYRGFPNADFHSPAYAYEIVKKPGLDDNKTKLLGTFSALNYSFNNIYLLDASFRLDGSSEFGTKHKWAPFWSLGTGINLHNTPYLKNLKDISVFRVKANLGQTGKSNFSPFMARNTYKILLDDWYSTGIGANIMYMGNDDLTWEKQLSWNFGTDISIRNKHTLEFNYYIKTTYDLITDVSLPTSSGFTVYRENIGKVENRGFEVKASVSAVSTRNFNLVVHGNLAHNKNQIKEIAESLKSYNARIDEHYGKFVNATNAGTYALYNESNQKYARPIMKYQEGGSLTTIYGMKSLGINPANGREVFQKRDGTITYDWSSMEQQAIGNTEPWAQGAFGLNARFKKLTLYTTFLYEWGGDQYNQTLITNVENANLLYFNADRRVMSDRWQKPGDISPMKAIQDRFLVTRPTSRVVQENNFIVFNSLSLGYDFDAIRLKKYHVNALRVSLLMNDIGRFTTIQREMGLAYPYARTYSFTLNATF